MKYADALAWLYARQRFGVKMGLDNVRELLRRLDDPQTAFPAYHVAGTNGKGSTAAFIESILRASGRKTALYTSPHLVSFRERIQIQGKPLPPEEIAAAVDRIRVPVEEMDARRTSPTYFEVVTAMAFELLRRHRVEVAVVEVGLGGRLDATNLCQPLVTVITSIGLDHTERLGTSIQAIAAEKAGILKPGIPAVTSARREALDVVAKQATKVKAPLKIARPPEQFASGLDGSRFKAAFNGAPADFATTLLGRHQVENAVVALAAIEAGAKRFPVELRAAQDGIANTRWPGRLEIVDKDPLTLLDGAHNPQGMEALGAFLGGHFKPEEVVALVGVVREKAAAKMMTLLGERVGRFILTEPPSPRALRVHELEGVLPPSAPPHESIADCNEALRALFSKGSERVRLVTGSLFLVGEARAQLLRMERDPDVKADREQ